MEHLKDYIAVNGQEYYVSTKNTFDVGFETMVFKSENKCVTDWSEKFFKLYNTKEEAEKKAKFNSVILMPHFLKESKKWENKIGIPLKYWSEAEHMKFKAYFMKKYGDMIK